MGGAIRGAVGSLALGAGAVPAAMVGGGIGLQVGNLILMGLGLAAIAEYFYQGLPPPASPPYRKVWPLRGLPRMASSPRGSTHRECPQPSFRNAPNARPDNWHVARSSWCCCC